MSEVLPKLALYFRRAGAYWELSDREEVLVVDAGPLGRYPLNLLPRLRNGHFGEYDSEGLPVRTGADGRTGIHNYTTLCCFALAHWEKYLGNGDIENLEKFLRVADYIVRTADRNGKVVRLRVERPGQGHVGEVSSIVQGEAISVLCRAWHATKRPEYLETAAGCAELFDVAIEDDGVVGRITARQLPWYEEYPAHRPLRHVLNGMIYSVWGLRELAVVSENSRAKILAAEGVDSIAEALPFFDNGFWSLYSLPEEGRPYVASMMYHSLHVCQLTALGQQTGKAEFLQRAERFKKYSRNALCRLGAAASMVRAKLSGN
jgi:heparosan-N-sulfate-glucuronate 5-epimerase